MPQLSTGHVFMSYSRKDDAVMRRIVTFLRKQGIKVWVDNEKLIPGTPVWEEEIEKAIKAAFAIVVVLSPDSKNSEWVRREISLADQYRRRVFPVLVSGDEESSITLRLINRQFVDIRKNENIGLGSLETALSAYLQELIEQEEMAKIAAKKLEEEKAKQLTAQKLAEEPKSEKEENIARKSLNLKADNTPASSVDYQKILWATLGWAIAGLIGGFIYSSLGDEIAGDILGGATGGAIGGFVTYFLLRNENSLSKTLQIAKFTLAWAIGGAIGWLIGSELTEATGAGIGMAIFAIIGLASTLGMDYIRSNWKSIAAITLAWAISGAIGWAIAKGMIEGLYIDIATSWAIGSAIGWAIGGFVMGRQLLRR